MVGADQESKAMDIGPPELILILLIVIVLFGVGRISKIGGELGHGIRAFKEGLQGSESDQPSKPEPVKAENTEESKP
jgi:sec-independent protein translocase protein TatA